MTLRRFILELVEPNTLIRLWYKTKPGHELVWPTDSPKMEHQVIKGEYAEHEVIGVTDIWVRGHYPESVNIVIERA